MTIRRYSSILVSPAHVPARMTKAHASTDDALLEEVERVDMLARKTDEEWEANRARAHRMTNEEAEAKARASGWAALRGHGCHRHRSTRRVTSVWVRCSIYRTVRDVRLHFGPGVGQSFSNAVSAATWEEAFRKAHQKDKVEALARKARAKINGSAR